MNQTINPESLRYDDYLNEERKALERTIISECVVAPENLPDTLKILKSDYFLDADCKVVFESIQEMYSLGIGIDPTTLRARVGPALAGIMKNATTDCGSNAVGHARMLKVLYNEQICRRSVGKLAETVSRPYYGLNDIKGKAEEVKRLSEDVVNSVEELSTDTKDSPQMLLDVLNERGEELQGGSKRSISTGIPSLDAITYGFRPGQLIVLAARPGVGKTSLALGMSKSVADSGTPVLFFSLEMTKAEIADKLLLSTGDLSPNDLKGKGIIDWNKFESAVGKIERLPLFIDDTHRNLTDMLAVVETFTRDCDKSLVVVDYLTLVSNSDNRQKPLYQILGDITRQLKMMAKEQNVPVLLLCQLNRESEKEGRPPQPYDLRDSGAIEQDADVILMLDSNDDKIRLWVRKNRNGRKDSCIYLEPNGTYSSFKETNCFIAD